MGMAGRLSLSGHWSEELQAHYSAIYRSREEIAAMLAQAFPAPTFQPGPITPLFDDGALNNRAETRQHFCLISAM